MYMYNISLAKIDIYMKLNTYENMYKMRIKVKCMNHQN